MNQTKHTMNIQCKDCKILQIYFPVTYDSASTKIEAYFSFLSGIAFPGSSSKEIFAFSNPPISVIQNPTVVDTDQWTFGNLIKEYHRQGISPENQWRILEQSNYEIADTYPKYLALPLEDHFSNEDVITAAKFRSKGRLPVITYRCSKTGAVLTRSSQPMVGLTHFPRRLGHQHCMVVEPRAIVVLASPFGCRRGGTARSSPRPYQ